jgi:hypothetical protein
MFHPTLSKSGRFFFWPLIKLCEFMGNHTPELLLKIRYWFVFRKALNLKNPQDINEKIFWAKLYSDTTQWTRLADKYEVRKYIEYLGLGDTLVKLYAAWFKKEDVDFDALPESFIIKANNGDGKGTNKIIHKSELTPEKKQKYIDLIGEWLSRKNIGALHAEPHYKNMRPCVIAEEVLPCEAGSSSLTDYKIWCFYGKAFYIRVYNNRNAGGNSAQVMTYDMDWNAHPEFSVFNSDYLEGEIIPKPKNFEKMIEIAEKLSNGFPELRVDLYNIDGKIYFGELTFTSQGGFMDNITPIFRKELGDKFDIKDFPLRNK